MAETDFLVFNGSRTRKTDFTNLSKSCESVDKPSNRTVKAVPINLSRQTFSYLLSR